MTNYVVAHIRTFTPTAVAFAATWLAANWNIIISDTTSQSVTLAVAGALTFVYYAGVRWLGRTWPIAERLLGTTAQPSYGSSVTK